MRVHPRAKSRQRVGRETSPTPVVQMPKRVSANRKPIRAQLHQCQLQHLFVFMVFLLLLDQVMFHELLLVEGGMLLLLMLLLELPLVHRRHCRLVLPLWIGGSGMFGPLNKR